LHFLNRSLKAGLTLILFAVSSCLTELSNYAFEFLVEFGLTLTEEDEYQGTETRTAPLLTEALFALLVPRLALSWLSLGPVRGS
jgi:hypothetical protein